MAYSGRNTSQNKENLQLSDFDFIFQKVTQKVVISSIEMAYSGRKGYILGKIWNKFQVNVSLLRIRHDTCREN